MFIRGLPMFTAAGIQMGANIVGGTAGSVLFVGTGGTLAQDNANFFFNDTTNALTVGGVITSNAANNAAFSAPSGGFTASSSSGFRTNASLILNEGASDVFLQAQGPGPYRLTLYSEMAVGTADDRVRIRSASSTPSAGNYLAIGHGSFTQVFAIQFAGKIVYASGNTQTTVGAAGGASGLPATPTGYIRMFIDATERVIPFYAQA